MIKRRALAVLTFCLMLVCMALLAVTEALYEYAHEVRDSWREFTKEWRGEE